jgi:hypothetical protein
MLTFAVTAESWVAAREMPDGAEQMLMEPEIPGLVPI